MCQLSISVGACHWSPLRAHRETRDGLWRYRLSDVIVVKGFAPEDRLPVLNHVRRRNANDERRGVMTTRAETRDFRYDSRRRTSGTDATGFGRTGTLSHRGQ